MTPPPPLRLQARTSDRLSASMPSIQSSPPSAALGDPTPWVGLRKDDAALREASPGPHPWAPPGVRRGESWSTDSWPVSVQVASSAECRRSAALLLERRYRWRGYGVVSLPLEPQPRRCTFTAVVDGEVVGTLTVGLDRPRGLACDALFGSELDALRLQGLHLCEFKRLAIDDACPHRMEALVSLFHAAFTHARLQHHTDVVLMEVNPRHVAYYAQRFGAQALGQPRRHDGVGALAVLMMLNLSALDTCAARLAKPADMPRRVLADEARRQPAARQAAAGFSGSAAPAQSAPEWRN